MMPMPTADASVYLTYSYQGRNWGLTWGGGASWEMGTDDSDFLDFKDQDFYQTGLTVDIGRFSIGGVFEYYHDLNSFETLDRPISGRPQRLGRRRRHCVQLPRLDLRGAILLPRRTRSGRISAIGDIKIEQVQQRAVATVNYALGPGINLDGEVGYTWRDRDPESTLYREPTTIMTGWNSASAPPLSF